MVQDPQKAKKLMTLKIQALGYNYVKCYIFFNCDYICKLKISNIKLCVWPGKAANVMFHKKWRRITHSPLTSLVLSPNSGKLPRCMCAGAGRIKLNIKNNNTHKSGTGTDTTKTNGH